MKVISEAQIETSIELLDASEAAYNKAVADFKSSQPTLFSYLFSDSFALLTAEEQSLMHYLALVIWHATAQEGTQPDYLLTEEKIGQLEESNWNLLNEKKGGEFRQQLDVFFDNSSQEELLALVEDTMLEDDESEDDLLTAEARMPIFVSLKTVIDCLT